MKFLNKDSQVESHDGNASSRRSPGRRSGGFDELNAFLGQGCDYEGKLTFKGTVRIDGNFSGEIFSNGTLIIGEGAEVVAEITVSEVIVGGTVRGNIIASERLELRRPAQVRGNIFSPALSIEEGVLFEGECRMTVPEMSSARSEGGVGKSSVTIETEPTADYETLA